MFINTVNTTINDNDEQKVFDSRYPKKIKEISEEKGINLLEERKLTNIITMYNKGRPVNCKINTVKEVVEGIPFLREKDTISIKKVDDEVISVQIDEIISISIISF